MTPTFSPLIDELIERLRCLPGVGPKSAQRMAFHLLSRERDKGKQLSQSLAKSMEDIGYCERCRTFSENPLCQICLQKSRDPAVLCVVETPADVLAVEQGSHFRGYYFVLMGHLSPLDGIGPEDIGLDKLSLRLAQGEIKEMVLATNPTVEGDATAHYIANMAKNHGIRATRIAYGVPIGGELEYIDSNTLAHAFNGRFEL